MKRLIGLIGATDPCFFRKKLSEIIRKHGYAWYGWTIPIREDILPILENQMKDPEAGYFNLYGYSSKGPAGYKASHRIEAIFIVKEIRSHRITKTDYNPCPQPDKGIQCDNGFYLRDCEDGHGKNGSKCLPRKTWFKVINIKKYNIDLTNKNFTSWNPKHKIHPSALRANFIDIVDT